MGESGTEGQQAQEQPGQSSPGNGDDDEQIKYPGSTGNGNGDGDDEEQIKYPG